MDISFLGGYTFSHNTYPHIIYNFVGMYVYIPCSTLLYSIIFVHFVEYIICHCHCHTANVFAVEPLLEIVLGKSNMFTLREERVDLTCFFDANMPERYGGLLVVNVL